MMLLIYWFKRLFTHCRVIDCKQRWLRYPCRGCSDHIGDYWFEYGDYMMDYWFEVKRFLGIAKRDPQ